MARATYNFSPSLSSLLDKIDRFLADYPRANYGPAHIVLSDHNLYNDHIDYCLDAIETGEYDTHNHGPEEIAATRRFLRSLRDIPEEERHSCMLELGH
jgi:hypothetical protein